MQGIGTAMCAPRSAAASADQSNTRWTFIRMSRCGSRWWHRGSLPRGEWWCCGQRSRLELVVSYTHVRRVLRVAQRLVQLHKLRGVKVLRADLRPHGRACDLQAVRACVRIRTVHLHCKLARSFSRSTRVEPIGRAASGVRDVGGAGGSGRTQRFVVFSGCSVERRHKKCLVTPASSPVQNAHEHARNIEEQRTSGDTPMAAHARSTSSRAHCGASELVIILRLPEKARCTKVRNSRSLRTGGRSWDCLSVNIASAPCTAGAGR